MSDLKQPVTHPAWCDPSRCIPRPEQPTEKNPARYGQHRSAPVAGSTLGTTVYLSQMIASWDCSVHLRVDDGGLSLHSISLDTSSPLLLMLRQHIAELQARYPSLMPPLDSDAE